MDPVDLLRTLFEPAHPRIAFGLTDAEAEVLGRFKHDVQLGLDDGGHAAGGRHPARAL